MKLVILDAAKLQLVSFPCKIKSRQKINQATLKVLHPSYIYILSYGPV